MVEKRVPLFHEILGIKDVFLKERYQDAFISLCGSLVEIIGRNSGPAICYLSSRDGNIPKLYQFLENLKQPPIDGFLSGWNELGDWTVQLATPTLLNFDVDILLEFKKYAANELLYLVENEGGREKYTYAKLKIEDFKVNHNTDKDTPLKRCEFWKLAPPMNPCFYYAYRRIFVSGPTSMDFDANSFIDFNGWICERCEDDLGDELTKQFTFDWFFEETDTIADYLLKIYSQAKD